jgi:hypothetical protein
MIVNVANNKVMHVLYKYVTTQLTTFKMFNNLSLNNYSPIVNTMIFETTKSY